jgi:DedD protein
VSERARYRLTGAVFLIALAAILLPMVFDGTGVEQDGLQGEPFEVSGDDVTEVEIPAPTLDEAKLAAATEVRQSVDDEGFDRATGLRIGEPALRQEEGSSRVPIDAWAVQVASFSEHANAEKFKDRLRQDGYAAFLSETKGTAGRSTRVAVGPFIERPEAERLRGEIARRYDAQAIVVRFEP